MGGHGCQNLLGLVFFTALVACSPVADLPQLDGSTGEVRLVGPALRVYPGEALDFGQVPYFEGAAAVTTRSLVLLNAGNADLRIDAIELREPASDELQVQGAHAVVLPASAGADFVELEVRLTPASLGAKEWALEIRSNDPRVPLTVVTIRATAVRPPPCNFTVSPGRIQLPPLHVPEAPEVLVTVRNEGTVWMEQCLVSYVRLASGADPAVTLRAPSEARLLGPQETLEIPVRIVPRMTPREIRADLEFDVSSTPHPHVVVPIRADFVSGSCVEVGPPTLNFAVSDGRCAAAPQSFTVYSSCATDVVLSGFAISGSSEFQLVNQPLVPVGGLRLLPGAAPVSLFATYRPVDAGIDAAEVFLRFGEGEAEVSHVVTLYGAAEDTGWQTDTFVIEPLPKADLLFVIDSSASMADDQSSLSTNLNAFLQYVKAEQVDFQIGVVTADASAGAALLTGPTHPDAVLARDTPNLDAQFAARTNVGSTSTTQPRCFEQALAALTSPQNAALVRMDASLAVICITDSTDYSPQAVSTYLDQLWGVKGLTRKTMFTFNAVAGFTPTCPGDQGRLADAVLQTNGVKGDLCTVDWHKTFESLGRLCFGPRTSFFLTARPDLTRAPIEVEIEGVSIPPIDDRGATVWTYDPMANAIDFELGARPGPGQTLTIRYLMACFG